MFYLKKTYVKIITIFLSLSNIHQADLRMELNKDKYKEIYGKILRLLDEKNKIYDPSEEMSYVLEYKIYYLLSILIFKNLQAQEILIEEYKLLDIIDEKCAKYFDLMNMIINSNKNKKELAQQKIESLVKTISKFYEMITYLLSGERGLYNKERIKLINVKNSNFSNLYEILTENDNFVNKYETFRTSYVWIKQLLRSIETDENI